MTEDELAELMKADAYKCNEARLRADRSTKMVHEPYNRESFPTMERQMHVHRTTSYPKLLEMPSAEHRGTGATPREPRVTQHLTGRRTF